ncbi:MAG: S9 family peptidase [Planctomycetota bacterium]|nr:S9 family peptidase [Planctomycetota bacterium]
MRRLPLLLALTCLAFGLPWAVAAAEDAPLIPRRTLFGNPDRANVTVSPDGSLLGFLAPLDGVMNVWIAPLEEPAAAVAVTHDTGRGIRRYQWCHDNRRMLYLADEGGNENWTLHAIDLVTRRSRALTPTTGVAARIEGLSPKRPRHVLVGLNARDPRLHDLHEIDLVTGASTLVVENPGFGGFLVDDDYQARFASSLTPDGGSKILRKAADGSWQPFATIGQEDALTTGPRGFDKSGRLMYLLDSRGRNTAALTAVDLESDEPAVVLAADDRADVADVVFHPTERYVQAVSINHARTEWTILDKSMAEHFEVLAKVDDGDLSLTSRSLDDRTWIVASSRSDGPVRYYHYDCKAKLARFLFTNRPALEGLALAPMRPVVVKARDGLDLVCYLTLPLGVERRPEKPLPMVLLVHGGPWARDSWGYNPMHQWLANRGYAALSVNFRGSTGFGKAFLNAANLQWGRTMHDDLLDAVAWAEKQGIADPARVAIMGGSYGGYATLIGLTLTPERFACGVDIVGPSNLQTLLASIPPYWKPMLDMFASRVGDPRTEEGRALLAERSPLTHVEHITKPLLIGQGKNDPRVKEAEAQQIVDAMVQRGIPVTYALYPDEGHGFQRPENSRSFFAIVEAFFARTLGGRAEPFGADLEGASLEVPEGAAHVPGLAEALGKRTGAGAAAK